MALPPATVYKKIVQTGQMAEELGADLLGLGAFTSVVGDAGLSIAQELSIPVTTGDSYTVQIAVEAARQAARKMGIDLAQATVAVVGATGAIGRVCAQLIAPDVSRLILIGRRATALEKLGDRIRERATASIQVSQEMGVLHEADVVIAVSSAIETLIEPKHLKPGAVVCDVARPRDVSRRVAAERNDVLVIDGGMVAVPGPANFNFDFGLPPGMVYACMAEAMALVMEGRYENFTLGRKISLAQVEQIAAIATKHGFKLGGFRSFERAVTPEYIESVRENAHRRRALPGKRASFSPMPEEVNP
ncbi:MAG: shikimate dehydrogenase [Anaerolineae bacterium]